MFHTGRDECKEILKTLTTPSSLNASEAITSDAERSTILSEPSSNFKATDYGQ